MRNAKKMAVQKMAVQKLIFLVLCLSLIISNATSFDSVKRDNFWPKCSGEELEYKTWKKGILPAIFQVIAATTIQGFIGQNYRFLNDNPDDKSVVYVISRCDGDLDGATCGKCIARAASKLIQSCLGFKESRIWLDKCYLQANINDALRNKDQISDNTYASVTHSDEFKDTERSFRSTRDELVKSVAKSAVEESNTKRFQWQQKQVSSDLVIEAMAQCNGDYTAVICRSCLNFAWDKMSRNCKGKSGCHFRGSGCVFWYDTKPFIDTNSPQP